MKTIHFPDKRRSHQVTTVPMVQFDSKSTSKLKSALHCRYSIVIEAGLGITNFIFKISFSICKIVVPVNSKLNPNNAYSWSQWSRQLVCH